MDYQIANPKPSALIESLRSIGYDLPTAVADIIDNSITAKAGTVNVRFHWAGAGSWIAILDDGRGMSEGELFEAMRPGSQDPLAPRSGTDLGRFGLGLKTASFSQARRLTVISKQERGNVAAREWDLDYVESPEVNEWRLFRQPSSGLEGWLEKVDACAHGTAVVWTKLDRLAGRNAVADAAAHNRFNDAIDHVRDYLAMIFHRFLEDKSLSILINEHPVVPWNPFAEHHSATYKTPEEVIPFGKTEVKFRGFVLPHKDWFLPASEAEYRRLGGINGWTAQQGFYVYRQRRLLVFGDWLRLGSPNPWTRDEQFKLARIRLDIGNDADADWQLDVKKSKARPPALITERLTNLAANVRARARTVFAHRGEFGPRPQAPQEVERAWKTVTRDGKRGYRINRKHPLVHHVIEDFGARAPEVEAMLRLLEETVPVEQIWLDTAEQAHDRAIPYETVEVTVLRSDLRRIFELLKKSGVSDGDARLRMRSIEPFNRYTKLIDEL